MIEDKEMCTFLREERRERGDPRKMLKHGYQQGDDSCPFEGYKAVGWLNFVLLPLYLLKSSRSPVPPLSVEEGDRR